MAADFKSNILRWDEKGFGGVPFKRLLFGGIAGGFTYTLYHFAPPDLAIPAGVVVALLVVVLTALRAGLPLWMRLWLNMRWSLLPGYALLNRLIWNTYARISPHRMWSVYSKTLSRFTIISC